MAPPEPKDSHLHRVPDFHGNPKLLNRFLSLCTKQISRFYNAIDQKHLQNEFLINNLLSNFKRETAEHVNVRIWNDVKNALIEAYSDRRDDIILLIEISNCKQNNKNCFDFYFNVLSLANSYLACVELYYPNPLDTVILRVNINKLALRVLILGLKERVGSLIRGRDPKTINEVNNLLTSVFQFDAEKSTSQNKIKTNVLPPI